METVLINCQSIRYKLNHGASALRHRGKFGLGTYNNARHGGFPGLVAPCSPPRLSLHRYAPDSCRAPPPSAGSNAAPARRQPPVRLADQPPPLARAPRRALRPAHARPARRRRLRRRLLAGRRRRHLPQPAQRPPVVPPAVRRVVGREAPPQLRHRPPAARRVARATEARHGGGHVAREAGRAGAAAAGEGAGAAGARAPRRRRARRWRWRARARRGRASRVRGVPKHPVVHHGLRRPRRLRPEGRRAGGGHPGRDAQRLRHLPGDRSRRPAGLPAEDGGACGAWLRDLRGASCSPEGWPGSRRAAEG